MTPRSPLPGSAPSRPRRTRSRLPGAGPAGPVLAALTVLLAGTACTADDRAAARSASGSGATVSAPVVAGSGEAAPSGSSAGTAPSERTTLGLALDGLRLTGGGSDRPVAFGTDRATLDALLSQYLGPVTTIELPECGQGPRTALEAGQLSVLFDGEQFVGWDLRGANDPPLALPDGVGVGSTRAEVQTAHEVSVEETTVGVEFFTRDGQFGGFLDGLDPTATVTGLHARETCYFR